MQRSWPTRELAPFTVQRNPERLRRSEGMAFLSQPPRNHDHEVHASAVTASRTSSYNLRESPRHPRPAPRATGRNSPDVPNLARSAESWQSGRRRSRRYPSAGSARFLQAPPQTCPIRKPSLLRDRTRQVSNPRFHRPPSRHELFLGRLRQLPLPPPPTRSLSNAFRAPLL